MHQDVNGIKARGSPREVNTLTGIEGAQFSVRPFDFEVSNDILIVRDDLALLERLLRTERWADAQYADGKAGLRPVYERPRSSPRSASGRTWRSWSRRPQCVPASQATRGGSGRVGEARGAGALLGAAPDGPRVVPTPGAMCAFRVDLPDADEVDGDVERWLRAAYERAGRRGATRASTSRRPRARGRCRAPRSRPRRPA
jgi:hypothetical protein